ncbi:MAG: hypothetical protein KKD86_01915 [Bacteroidetes bacterium]|nr:hypothetical protein [Bacteroidota bacterium]MBU1677604.1 hypothetical protein [Bacteroidota bacterium]
MKFIKIILFSIFFFISNSNFIAQEIIEKKEKIDTLFKFAKEITNTNEISEIIDMNLEKTKKMIFEAYKYAPIEFNKELHKWTEEWRSTGLKGVKPPIGIKPSTLLKKIKEKIAEKSGWEYVRFLETPYFMKVKILDISYSTYSLKARNREFQQIDLKAEILDVIKGKEFYSVSDTITVSYLPFWFNGSSIPIFEINQVYAFPLRHWSYLKYSGYNNLLLKLNGLHTLYKIENDIVHSPLNVEMSPLKSWESFINDFKQKFLMEK